MGAHEDRIKAMEFDHPEFIPIGVGLLPATWISYREKLEEIISRHPIIFGEYAKGSRDFDAVSGLYVEGEQTDAWGCQWKNIRKGCDAMCVGHPIPTREAVHTYKPPAPGAGLPHGFMYMRLFYLRGFEEVMVDFAEEPPELQMLIDMVCEYNCGEVRKMCENKLPKIVGFGDDLGMQHALPISPAKWHKYLTPCFKKIYGIVHAAGSSVYMHTDGCIIPIISELIECGVNVVNPQIRANGLDNLARECRGKVCVNLDLDRQMFPFCKPEDIDGHIREAVEKLSLPEGGLWISAECGPDVPLETIEAICVALEKYRAYYR
ncbi:MAG TPA: uroporphyrinogen decarboxylase family protein [Candidatus Brocadiia bacterium]|nr:uroporphyrinogen decarboxylase family protein [Candidatus Brocadiia bacterium]